MSSLSVLPEGYTYLMENSEGTLKVRIAEIHDEAGARAWMKELQAVSCITWRVSKTYPRSGRLNLFQLDMRCQHKTDSRAQHTKRPHKHTGCPASLHIVVKKIVKYSRSRSAAKNSAYPTIVRIDRSHNHSIDNAAALKFRDMSPDTKQTLLDLFHHGHNASSALHCLKTDLLLKHGDEYFRVAADGHFAPSVSRVQKLYDSEFKKEYGAMSGEHMFSDLEKLLEDYCDKNDGGTAKFGRFDSQYFVAICSPVMARAHQKVIQTSELVMVDAAGGLASNPDVFIPAVRKMLINIDHHAATETGLVSAISTFGKYSGVPAAHRRRFGAKIGVQPTAIGRRKLCLTGRRRLGPGRLRQDGKATVPRGLESHDYTSFGNLPAHKRKAPHNLQACVYRDTGLGCVKKVKL